MTNLKEKYGPWAVITGASSGIGREFALQLAQAGVNTVLIARRKELLDELSDEITDIYPVETRVIDADLASADAFDKIDALTRDLDIGLLVSNAGAGFPGAFLKDTLESRTSVVQLNVHATVQLTYLFGKKMMQRGGGGILLVSSVGALLAGPWLANYTATKAFILSFGESLKIELEKDGIDVCVLLPGATRTEMAAKEGADFSHIPGFMWSNSTDVARAGLAALGNKTVVIPGTVNKISSFIMNKLLPRRLASIAFGKTIQQAINQELV
jgi:uncharacterized protein